MDFQELFINDSKIVSEDIRDQYRSNFIRYSKKGSVTYVLEVCLCHACDRWFTMCLRLFMVTTTRSIQKVIRNRNLQNKMEDYADDSTVQGSKEREIKLIKWLENSERKGVQKRKLFNTMRK